MVSMKKTLFLSAFLAAVVTSVAQAIPVPVAWFADDFESYASGTRLRSAAPGWIGGAGPENLILAGGSSGQAVRLRGSAGNGASSSATNATSVAALSAGNFQILDFSLQSDIANQTFGYNHITIQLNDSVAAEMGRWFGRSDAVTPRLGGTLGTPVDMTDGAVHNFSITYDPVTGLTEWLHNGSVQMSLIQAAGLACERVSVQDTHRVDDITGDPINDWIWLDNVVIGTVPEPASLLLLGLGGLLVFRRR